MRRRVGDYKNFLSLRIDLNINSFFKNISKVAFLLSYSMAGILIFWNYRIFCIYFKLYLFFIYIYMVSLRTIIFFLFLYFIRYDWSTDRR